MSLRQNNPQIPADEVAKKAAAVEDVRAALPRDLVFDAVPVATVGSADALAAPPTGWKAGLTRVPLLGHLILWVSALGRLVAWRQQLTVDAQHLQARADALTLHLTELATHVEVTRAQAQLAEDARFLALEARLSRSVDRLRTQLGGVERRLQIIGQEQSSRLAALRADLTRLQVLRSTPADDRQAAAAVMVPSADLSRFYLEFENTFRGEMADIKERMRPQLQWLPKACHEGAMVVDVGCGRGEWLSLLRDQGVGAIGIDMNADMVLRCTEQGLDARCADAVQWLREQPPGSIGAVTAFHLIEHLPFETLIALFDAALHALRPDGMILFETPNPENLLVGACNFYLDPTHRNPIPPAAAQFMALQRGFARADILRLHPYDTSSRLKEQGETQDLLNHLLYGPQDYAIAAWKQSAPPVPE